MRVLYRFSRRWYPPIFRCPNEGRGATPTTPCGHLGRQHMLRPRHSRLYRYSEFEPLEPSALSLQRTNHFAWVARGRTFIVFTVGLPWT
eukprot:1181743-Prorocentrum_minimum.AAC.2